MKSATRERSKRRRDRDSASCVSSATDTEITKHSKLALPELTKLQKDLHHAIVRLEKDVDKLEMDTTMSPLSVLAILQQSQGDSDVELEFSTGFDAVLGASTPTVREESDSKSGSRTSHSGSSSQCQSSSSSSPPTTAPSTPLPAFDETGDVHWKRLQKRLRNVNKRLRFVFETLDERKSAMASAYAATASSASLSESTKTTALFTSAETVRLKTKGQKARSRPVTVEKSEVSAQMADFSMKKPALILTPSVSSLSGIGDAETVEQQTRAEKLAHECAHGFHRLQVLWAQFHKRETLRLREAAMEERVLIEGYLLKRGHLVKSWKRRLFRLTSDGLLRYYNSKGILLNEINAFETVSIGIDTGAAKDKLKSVLKKTSLTSDMVLMDARSLHRRSRRKVSLEAVGGGGTFMISLEMPTRTYLLKCATQEERDGWVMHLQSFMHRDSVSTSFGGGSLTSSSDLRWASVSETATGAEDDEDSDECEEGEEEEEASRSERRYHHHGGGVSASYSVERFEQYADDSLLSKKRMGKRSKKKKKKKIKIKVQRSSLSFTRKKKKRKKKKKQHLAKLPFYMNLSALELAQLMQRGVFASFQEEFEDVATLRVLHSDRQLQVTMHEGVFSSVTDVCGRIASSFLRDCGAVALQSWLRKKVDGGFQHWNKRWCVLLKSNTLVWYASKDDTEPRGSLDLDTLVAVSTAKSSKLKIDNVFQVTTAKRKIRFSADSSALQTEWIDLISIFSTHQRQYGLSLDSDEDCDSLFEQRKYNMTTSDSRIDPVIF